MSRIVYMLQTDAYAVIILIIIFINVIRRADLKDTGNRIYLLLVEVTAAALILDMLIVLMGGAPGRPAHLAMIVITALYYILNPIPGVLWMAYADYFIYHDATRLKRYALPVATPAIVNGAVAVLSLFGGYAFHIGSDNIYHRGPYFFVMAIICYLYTLLTTLHIFRSRALIRCEARLPMLLFAVPPLVGGTLQAMMYGIVLLWPSLVVSLLIAFVYVQSVLMNTDHLTGLFNRREFDYHLSVAGATDQLHRKKNTAGIMLDLDYFKQINDTYGHNAGDKALIQISNILRSSFRHTDFLARLGGDEFAVILEVTTDSELKMLVNRLEQNIAAFNASGKEPYLLNVSIGYGIFLPETGQTILGFFNELDSRMYHIKRIKRQNSETMEYKTDENATENDMI